MRKGRGNGDWGRNGREEWGKVKEGGKELSTWSGISKLRFCIRKALTSKIRHVRNLVREHLVDSRRLQYLGTSDR